MGKRLPEYSAVPLKYTGDLSRSTVDVVVYDHFVGYLAPDLFLLLADLETALDVLVVVPPGPHPGLLDLEGGSDDED
jgi:hypothetical protein